MKKYWKGLILFLSFLLIACSNDRQSTSENSAPPGTGVGIGGDAAGEDGGVRENLVGDKVIRTVQIQFETLEYDSTLDRISEIVRNHEAFVEYSNESSYTPSGSFGPDAKQYRRVEYIVRVPTDVLDQFLSGLDELDAVKTSEQLGTEDVTKTYRDSEARIEVLRQKEARLTELLEQAATIEEILLIEDQLSITIAERESLQAQIDTIDDLIAYTEVRMNITERQRISEGRGDAVPFWTRVREAIVDSAFAFYYWIQDSFIWLIYLLPYLIIFALLFFLYQLISRWYRKTDFAKKRKTERQDIQMQPRQRNRIKPDKADKEPISSPDDENAKERNRSKKRNE